MNGRYRFSVLRSTGHVLSEKALKEVCIWAKCFDTDLEASCKA